MIVNSLVDGWEVIYQRSHANLAAMLTAGWRWEDRPARWTELLIATAQHDDQEMFWDDSVHLTELGAPLDFTQGTMDTTLSQARLVIRNAFRQGIWIALLISRHNSALYESKRGESAELDAFLDEQRALQEQWRKLIGCSREAVDSEYGFLRWGDSLSLILCRRHLPEAGLFTDVAPGPDGQMVRVGQREDGTLLLDPWVLEKDEMRFSLEVRRLHQLKFKNESHFQKLLDTAEIEQREWRFVR